MLYLYEVSTGCLVHSGIVRSCSKAQAMMDVERRYENYTNFKRDSIDVKELNLEEGQIHEMKCEKP
jgi:hypothetical protein